MHCYRPNEASEGRDGIYVEPKTLLHVSLVSNMMSSIRSLWFTSALVFYAIICSSESEGSRSHPHKIVYWRGPLDILRFLLLWILVHEVERRWVQVKGRLSNPFSVDEQGTPRRIPR